MKAQLFLRTKINVFGWLSSNVFAPGNLTSEMFWELTVTGKYCKRVIWRNATTLQLWGLACCFALCSYLEMFTRYVIQRASFPCGGTCIVPLQLNYFQWDFDERCLKSLSSSWPNYVCSCFFSTFIKEILSVNSFLVVRFNIPN